MPPFFSVIVITKNNAGTIQQCIVSLLNQTYSKEGYELIFVDGHSRDGTDKTIRKYAQDNSFLKLCYENQGTMGYARNLGVRESKGDIIAFTDGDAVVPEDWIEQIARLFSNNNQLVAMGGFDELVSSRESGKLIDSWRRLKRAFGIKAIPCIKTVNFAIRREAILSCDGFDPNLSHWDEAEVMARLYSKSKTIGILYDPEIVVCHNRGDSPSLQRHIKKMFKKSIIGTPVLMRRHMMNVALANPTSPMGISFLLIPICLLSIPILSLSFLAGIFVNVLLLFSLLYLVVLGVYLAYMFRRTHSFSPEVPLFLTIDFITRFVGTFFGLLKWLKEILFKGNRKAKSSTC